MKLRFVIGVALCIFAMHGYAVDASNRYRSPRNPERAIRRSTELIVLHTTEAPERSSLNKLSDRGEAHYCVTEVGRIFRIVDRDREAFHAGRSMWNGKEDVDKFSIGIECVGYHDKPMPDAQLTAIRQLVKELQSMYHISDDKVVCHSHVAYGAPNRWHKKNHRGRKRCGMLFAMPSIRRRLGLTSRPKVDVDVKKGRLVIGDDYLNSVLYGKVDTMAGKTGAPPEKSAPPPPPAPPKESIIEKVKSGIASITSAKSDTPPQNESDLKAKGYTLCGTIGKANTASRIAGKKWNSPDTYYIIKGRAVPGSQIDPKKLGTGVTIWMKR